MPTTSNFGWTTPADTDLVKDGAAAIRTLGNGVDTSLVDLKGGTTGQILSKNSNTDLDYTWVTPNVGDITEVQAGTGISVADGTGPIPVVTNTVATEFDAKGDLIVGTGSDTFDRLAVGTDGYTLVADISTSTGLAWAAASTGANWSLLNTGGTALTGAVTVTVSGISNVDKVMVLVSGASTGANQYILFRINTDSGNNYYPFGQFDAWASTYNAAEHTEYSGSAQSSFEIGKLSGNASSQVGAGVLITGCNSSGVKMVDVTGAGSPATSTGHTSISTKGYYNSASTVSSISIVSSSGNLDAGTVYVYTSA